MQRVCGADTPFPLAMEKIYLPDELKVGCCPEISSLQLLHVRCHARLFPLSPMPLHLRSRNVSASPPPSQAPLYLQVFDAIKLTMEF